MKLEEVCFFVVDFFCISVVYVSFFNRFDSILIVLDVLLYLNRNIVSINSLQTNKQKKQ